MANEGARHLRKSMTRHEARLWLHLRDLRKRGFHFRRQVPIDSYIVDFACYHPKLVVEVDGSQHGNVFNQQRDETRDAHLIASGFRVLRFWNADIEGNLEGLLTAVLTELEKAPHPGGADSAAVPPREGEGFNRGNT
jgi:very-short-patch-repair endonuclease